jgi:hypothetical protein
MCSLLSASFATEQSSNLTHYVNFNFSKDKIMPTNFPNQSIKNQVLRSLRIMTIGSAAILSSATQAAAIDGLVAELTTKNYVVNISTNCEEGPVTCDNVTYRGLSKQTGKAITLKGSTKHTMCADGITPCRSLGYEFKSGNITYLVLDSGVLQVLKDKSEVLLEEQGKWK